MAIASRFRTQRFPSAAAGDKHLKEKKKIGRPQLKDPMVHTAVVLPQELINYLKTTAEECGRGLSAEIRYRLQSQADLEKRLVADPVTTDLLHSIRSLADNLKEDMGEAWYRSADVLSAFTAGVTAFFAQFPLEAESAGAPERQALEGQDEPPDVIGRILARRIWTEQYAGVTSGRQWRKPKLSNQPQE
jgi:hypothetical protein